MKERATERCCLCRAVVKKFQLISSFPRVKERTILARSHRTVEHQWFTLGEFGVSGYPVEPITRTRYRAELPLPNYDGYWSGLERIRSSVANYLIANDRVRASSLNSNSANLTSEGQRRPTGCEFSSPSPPFFLL